MSEPHEPADVAETAADDLPLPRMHETTQGDDVSNDRVQPERWPFEPPYTREDLPQLDRLHIIVGLGLEWIESKERAVISERTADTDGGTR